MSHGIFTDKYINPETITTRINEKLRVEKEDDNQIWQELLEKAQSSGVIATKVGTFGGPEVAFADISAPLNALSHTFRSAFADKIA